MNAVELAQVMDMHEALEPFAGFTDWWCGSRQKLFAERAMALGKPLRDLTVGELQTIAAEVSAEMKPFYTSTGAQA
ncbi:hypothetical protein ACU4EH_13050 [Pseudomonas aeruginosa]|uniref:hypothetical protein n=1 Tax=Pseudomonas aeruginosa TaxID=287 RepID=UPI001EDB8A14|nr:hypothetical protein [Pseudomonas aeruginosa]MCG3008953.1 hypothetical protein [Pseudomonas aeruginosa]MCV6567171.1 hypothetical protein [Pseudomonas aeruginosa]HBO2284485.1 hypothetical protein [Pseudomonas aeruginosa]HCL4087914.1 hypothetical protein [Pseudomonas aeruginosa]